MICRLPRYFLSFHFLRIELLFDKQLVGMFSGYKQCQAFTYDVLAAVEHFVKENEGWDLFDDLGEWDEGELHRLGKCCI